MRLSDEASIFRIGLSTFINASATAGLPINVAFERTDTFASGKYLSRSSSVTSIISGKSGFIVGSPLPENVMESTGTPSDAALDIFSSNAALTSSSLGNTLSAIPSLFQPHSQYTQSKLHSFPFEGRRFTPREEPSLRLNIGPNTMSSKCSISDYPS